jgi:integrase
MSRRSGQNPKLELRNGVYSFRYRKDVPGQEARVQVRKELGAESQLTRSEAKRLMREILTQEEINVFSAKIPSASTFAHAVRHYREDFAPVMLRDSTFAIADSHIRTHLEPNWSDVPIEHITIDAVNEWAHKKRQQGLSWTSIKNVLRTMQRILSAFSKDRKPPFSLSGLIIPAQDKLRMHFHRRNAPSFTWEQARKIAAKVRKSSGIKDKLRYETLILLLSASGLRFGEASALRVNDLDLRAGTVRVDEGASQAGDVLEPKNVRAYRTVVLLDKPGKQAMKKLKALCSDRNPNEFVFASRQGTPLRESNVLHRVLHPALTALGLPKAGCHAFRRGYNRRWDVAGISHTILQQQMGHGSDSRMTDLYSGQIPLEQVRAAINPRRSGRIVTRNVTSVTRRQIGAVA